MHNELNNYSFWKPISHECFLQKNMFNPWITYFKLKPVQIPTKAFVQQVRHIILAQWRHNDSHHDDLQRCRARVSNCECRSKETFTAPGYTFLTTVYKRTYKYVCMYVISYILEALERWRSAAKGTQCGSSAAEEFKWRRTSVATPQVIQLTIHTLMCKMRQSSWS